MRQHSSFPKKIEQKVFQWMEQFQMLSAGDRVVVGVSGGADSMCLLALLLRFREQQPLELEVVHVHHGLRPEAHLDAKLVEDFCREQEIPFHLVRENVAELASKEHCSIEDAGRRLRYQAFEALAQQTKATKIAVAHNAGDRAETMLLHLFRGSGLRGLCGIEPVRGRLIRPILCLEREQIEAYLRCRQIAWAEDATNQEDTYTRNRVRHHILPYAEEQISEKVVQHMCRTAELLSETEEYLCRQTDAVYDTCFTGKGFLVKAFCQAPKVLQRRMLLKCLEELSPTGKDISQQHVEDVLDLFLREGNGEVHLPFGIRARRCFDKVEFVCGEEDTDFRLPKLVFRTFPAGLQSEIPRSTYTKWFDCDTIKDVPEVRFRRSGDYLCITDGDGNLRHKSLKEYMIGEKIPRQYRDRIPLLADGDHILWVIGHRISEKCKVTAATRRILEVSCPEGEAFPISEDT